MLPIRLALLLSAVVLTSCATKPVEIRTTSDACSALSELTYHYDASNPKDTDKNEIDTPETVKAIQAYNARLEALCKKEG